MKEISQIARRIPNVWMIVAHLTRLFETYEFENMSYPTLGEDGTHKARAMLTRYMERGGTRQRLAGALEKLGLNSLSRFVQSGYFIDTGEEE